VDVLVGLESLYTHTVHEHDNGCTGRNGFNESREFDQ